MITVRTIGHEVSKSRIRFKDSKKRGVHLALVFKQDVYNWKGDLSFRSNVPYIIQVDLITQASDGSTEFRVISEQGGHSFTTKGIRADDNIKVHELTQSEVDAFLLPIKTKESK